MPNAREKATLMTETLEQELALWRFLRIGLVLLGALLIALSFVVRNPLSTTVKAWPVREPAKVMELEVELPKSTNPLLLIGLVLFVTPLASWRGDRTKRTLLQLLQAKDDTSSR